MRVGVCVHVYNVRGCGDQLWDTNLILWNYTQERVFSELGTEGAGGSDRGRQGVPGQRMTTQEQIHSKVDQTQQFPIVHASGTPARSYAECG